MTVSRYNTLMRKASEGDRKAAADLILGEWWPGDPESASSIDRVISIAKVTLQEHEDRKAKVEAQVRSDRARRAREEVAKFDGVSTAKELADWLYARDPRMTETDIAVAALRVLKEQEAILQDRAEEQIARGVPK